MNSYLTIETAKVQNKLDTAEEKCTAVEKKCHTTPNGTSDCNG
jgi:hypothetical protein